MVDCLRADKCWGNARTAKTPGIDALCRRGVTFTQAITTATTTSPAVASILTGLYPLVHGVRSLRGYKLNTEVRTLAEVLSQSGYHTYAEVTGPLMPQLGISKGFTHYHLRDKSSNVYSPWYDDLLTKFRDKEFQEPYFIFLHLFELHLPRVVAKEYNNNDFGKNRYERALSSLDASLGKLLSYVDDDTVIIFHADHGEKIAQTMLEEYSFRIRDYLSKLKRKVGLEERGKPKLQGHSFHVYDYLIRVPLVFVGKGIFPEGKVISDQVRQIDIFPTVIQALQLKYEDSKIHGRSLFPLIKGKTMPEIPAYCEACGQLLTDQTRWLAGIRSSKYKYVFTPYASNVSEELYDLEKDPNEEENIITKRPEIAQELREQLREIRKADEVAAIKQRIRGFKGSGKI